MPQYIPIGREQHQYAGLAPKKGYAFASKEALVPVLAEEMPHILPTIPTGFVYSEDTKAYQLVAIQSLEPGLNLYIHPDGRWFGGYTPSAFRGYPFALLPAESSDKLVLCIDTDSGLLHPEAEEGDQRLYTPEGEPVERLTQTAEFLQKRAVGQQQTNAIVAQLAKLDLIVPWNVQLQLTDQEKREPIAVKGLFHIDEQALRSLPAEQLKELSQSGALALAYTQLLSEHRMKGLLRLYELRKKIKQNDASVEEPDLDALFGDEDDLLRF